MTRNAFVCVSDPARAAGIVERLAADGMRVAVTGRPADADAAVAEFVTRFSTLDALVIDVVSPPAARFTAQSADEWFRDVRSALSDVFRLVRAAVPALMAGTDARIVVVGAGWGVAEAAHSSAAAATQGGAVALVKTLARDLGPHGVTVNQVAAPGSEHASVGAIARGVAYLLSPAAGATTGQILTVGSGGPVRP